MIKKEQQNLPTKINLIKTYIKIFRPLNAIQND